MREMDFARACDKYDAYLKEHKANVAKGYAWLKARGLVRQSAIGICDGIIQRHDESKSSAEEYGPYVDYFYGARDSETGKRFNRAWLHHIQENPHHWQHWVLLQDDGSEECLDMPYWYIVEMVADWWSFSWKTGDLYEIFGWYEKHKAMKLSENTRKIVEDLLRRIKSTLDKEN